MPLDQTLLDTIRRLASEIAREAPDCADKAMQIESLACDLARAAPDRATVEDTLAAFDDTALSDVSERRTADAIVSAMRRTRD